MALLTYIPKDEWSAENPKTAIHRFVRSYLQMLDNADWINQNSLRFYSTSCIFHNQNGIALEGSQNLWRFLPKLFAPVLKMRHEVLVCKQIENPENSYIEIELQAVRHLWFKEPGCNQQTPTVSVPLHATMHIIPTESAEGDLGYQMKEIWIYWDTALLSPYLQSEAVMFDTNSGWESTRPTEAV